MPDPTFKIDSTTVLSKSGTTVSVDSGLNIKPAFAAPDTASTNLQNTSMAKNTTLPIFACRAFVVFDGTNVDGSNNCQLYSSGNISKVVRVATGNYKVHMATEMPDTLFCVILTGSGHGSNNGYAQHDGSGYMGVGDAFAQTTTTFNIRTTNNAGSSTAATNHFQVSCAVFR